MIEQIITSSVLIVAVLMLSALLERRINPCIKYGLWLLVAVKLLVPIPEFESHISVMNLVMEERTVQSQVLSEELIDANETVGIEWGMVIQTMWVAGMVLCAFIFVSGNLRFSQGLKRCRVPIGRFKDKLSVYQVQGVTSPCLFGLFKPSVYLPDNFELTEEQKNHVCTHEYVHYCHGDHVWAVIRCVCVIVYWFHPLVWIAAGVSMKDSELACDYGTLKRIGNQNHLAYGQTLIEVARNGGLRQPEMGVLRCSTGAVGGMKEMKRRMEMIVKQPRTKMLSLVLLTVVCIILVGCTFSSGVEKAESSAEAKNETYAVLQDEQEEITVQIAVLQAEQAALQAEQEEVQAQIGVLQTEIAAQRDVLHNTQEKQELALKAQQEQVLVLEKQEAALMELVNEMKKQEMALEERLVYIAE